MSWNCAVRQEKGQCLQNYQQENFRCLRSFLLVLVLFWIMMPVKADSESIPMLAEDKVPDTASEEQKKKTEGLESLEDLLLCEENEVLACNAPSWFSQIGGAQVNCGCKFKQNNSDCKYKINLKNNDNNRDDSGKSMVHDENAQGWENSIGNCLQSLADWCNNPHMRMSADDEKNGIASDLLQANPDDCMIIAMEFRFQNKRQAILDSNCQSHEIGSVPMNEICGDLTMTYITTPISLLWTEDASVDADIRISNFPLDPSGRQRWFTWKASAKAPLLVYDPNHLGVVSDATQLFGNWTFGGKRLAALENGVKREFKTIKPYWQHGYEALSALDINQDEKLSGEELAALALWFDNNRDGISQTGEVKSLNELKVVTLYMTPDRADSKTYDIYATRGYERIVDGKLVTGQSVDWFAEGAKSKMALIAGLDNRRNLAQATQESFDSTYLSGITKSSVSQSKSVAGNWQWIVQADQGIAASSSSDIFGLLVIRERGKEIIGQSVIELPLTSQDVDVKSLLTRSLIKGQKMHDADGKLVISFEATSEGSRTKSKAFLSSDGKTLFGKSTTEIFDKLKEAGATNVSYTWIAHKL